jgi:hypothetical protein
LEVGLQHDNNNNNHHGGGGGGGYYGGNTGNHYADGGGVSGSNGNLSSQTLSYNRRSLDMNRRSARQLASSAPAQSAPYRPNNNGSADKKVRPKSAMVLNPGAANVSFSDSTTTDVLPRPTNVVMHPTHNNATQQPVSGGGSNYGSGGSYTASSYAPNPTYSSYNNSSHNYEVPNNSNPRLTRPNSAHSSLQRTQFHVLSDAEFRPSAAHEDDLDLDGIFDDEASGPNDYDAMDHVNMYAGRLATPDILSHAGHSDMGHDGGNDVQLLDERTEDMRLESITENMIHGVEGDRWYSSDNGSAEVYSVENGAEQMNALGSSAAYGAHYEHQPSGSGGVSNSGSNKGHTWTKVGGSQNIHLPRVATSVSTLRSIILHRHRSSRKPLSTIFLHFDRRNCGHFDVNDLKDALLDLHLDASRESRDEIISAMAMNSSDEVVSAGGASISFGEFTTFVLDADHSALFTGAVSHLSKRRVSELISSIHNTHAGALISAMDGQQLIWSAFKSRAFVARSDFEAGLKRLFPLNSNDVSRLTRRFDVFGDGVCSVVKLVQAILRTSSWRLATSHILHHVECYEQALWALRRGINDGGLSGDAVNAALALSIRVSSDADKMWIVHEMLDSPLPPGWESFEVVEEDETGTEKFTVYVRKGDPNTGPVEQMDHPLLSHFKRIVRDDYLRAMHISGVTSASGGAIMNSNSGVGGGGGGGSAVQFGEHRIYEDLQDTPPQTADNSSRPSSRPGSSSRPSSSEQPEQLQQQLLQHQQYAKNQGSGQRTHEPTDQHNSSSNKRPSSAQSPQAAKNNSLFGDTGGKSDDMNSGGKPAKHNRPTSAQPSLAGSRPAKHNRPTSAQPNLAGRGVQVQNPANANANSRMASSVSSKSLRPASAHASLPADGRHPPRPVSAHASLSSNVEQWAVAQQRQQQHHLQQQQQHYMRQHQQAQQKQQQQDSSPASQKTSNSESLELAKRIAESLGFDDDDNDNDADYAFEPKRRAQAAAVKKQKAKPKPQPRQHLKRGKNVFGALKNAFGGSKGGQKIAPGDGTMFLF